MDSAIALAVLVLAVATSTANLLPRTVTVQDLSRAWAPVETCPDGGEPTPVSLSQVWAQGQEREPGFMAPRQRMAAGEAARGALSREWFPTFHAEGLWNYGQRTSPGEERVLGVGPRGDLRLLGSWTVLDGGRQHRAGAIRASTASARAEGDAFHTRWQGEVARLWTAGLLAERTVEVLEGHQEELTALFAIVERRARAGVEADWEVRLLEEARARAHRLLAGAEEARAATRAALGEVVGACVRPPPGEPSDARLLSPPFVDQQDSRNTRPDHEVRRLLHEADAREAEARAVSNVDRWELALVGGAGPTRSRAFEPGPVEREYLAGVSGRLRLDLAGVRRMNQRAGEAESHALRAEAESLRLALDREAASLAAELPLAELHGAALQRELTSAEESLASARLRWNAGVEGWSQVMQALDRRLDALLGVATWEHDTLQSQIRLAELHDSLEELAVRLEGPR